jgi:hypothetical protein
MTEPANGAALTNSRDEEAELLTSAISQQKQALRLAGDLCIADVLDVIPVERFRPVLLGEPLPEEEDELNSAIERALHALDVVKARQQEAEEVAPTPQESPGKR